jgi:MSHA biogenesis protein MshG
MPAFAYSGRNAGGELVQGTLESIDASAVATQLLGTGITPVDIRPASAPAAERSSFAVTPLFGNKIKPVDLLLFSRQLHTLLKSGVPILQALAGLQQSATNPAFAGVLQRVRESLQSGRDFSAALVREPQVFTPFYVAMIRVGESTGRLEEVLARLYDHLEFDEFMRNQVKSAVRYPLFVMLAMAGAMVVINLFVIPAFAKVFKGFNAKLPFLTQVLIDFSDFMVAWWPMLLAGSVAAVFGFRSWVRTVKGRFEWDRYKLKIPIAGKIIMKATLARFGRSFALASRSGVPVVAGLSLVGRTVDNEFIAARIEKMREGVERGESVLRTAVAAGVFTPIALQMIAVGEESGALDDLTEDVGDMYQREVEYELKTLSAQIEPILIVALGIMVLILALGVFLPMWDLSQAMFKR